MTPPCFFTVTDSLLTPGPPVIQCLPSCSVCEMARVGESWLRSLPPTSSPPSFSALSPLCFLALISPSCPSPTLLWASTAVAAVTPSVIPSLAVAVRG